MNYLNCKNSGCTLIPTFLLAPLNTDNSIFIDLVYCHILFPYNDSEAVTHVHNAVMTL